MAIERERIAAQSQIAGLQVGAKMAVAEKELSAQQQEQGLRIGVEIARETSRPPQMPAQPQQPVKPEENSQ